MYNFDQVCRTCSLVGEMKPLFSGDTIELRDMIMEVADVKITHGDGYPGNICIQCIEELRTAYAFKKKCEDTEAKFTLYLNASCLKREAPEEVKLEIPELPVSKNDHDDTFENTCSSYGSNSDDSDEDIKPDKTKVNAIKKQDSESDVSAGKNKRYPNGDAEPEQSNDSNTQVLKRKGRKPKNSETKSKKRDSDKNNKVCYICKKSFTYHHKLRTHMRAHTKEKPFKCDKCDNSFSLKSNLARHIKTHTGERPHKCPICGKGFIQSPKLIIHLRMHTGERPYKCHMCGKGFIQAHGLNNHIKTHNRTGPRERKPKNPEQRDRSKEVSCDICNRICSNKSVLKTHKLTHGDKTFLCSDCGKGFVSNSGLQSHIKTHTGVKPYTCTVCNKSFSLLNSLKAHKLIHTGERPHTCKRCNKSFTQSNHLKYHLRTHSGEKPYKCSVCGKKFTLNGTLTVHMRIHTGETPYLCPICGKGFYDSSSMKKHKSRHGYTGVVLKQEFA